MSQGLLFILFAVLIGSIEACGPTAPRKARPIPPRPMKRDVNLPITSDDKSLTVNEKTEIDVIKMTQDLFALFDHNEDGVVNLDEILTDSVVESLTNAVRKADTNGDGLVTLQEFQKMMLS
ncbi:uncharacterized protein [Antedon mediterranea]|uniref:uncharacterized protein n=1 Tax=Antedon mediterranea TaxID=105859 RepID=UPI003AF99B04